MVITINILDIKQAVEEGKLSFKVGPKGVYCIDEITQECLLVTVERKDNKDLQYNIGVSENLNLKFTVVKKRIKPVDMFGIREAVENGVIGFERTKKGIYCTNLLNEERVLVGKAETAVEVRKPFFVICKETEMGRTYLQIGSFFLVPQLEFGSVVTALRFDSFEEAARFMCDLRVGGFYNFDDFKDLKVHVLHRRKVKEI